MSTINEAFLELRRRIPTFPYEKRLSKIDTLNLAIAYISMLDDILHSRLPAEETVTKAVSMARYGNPHAPTWSTSDLVSRLAWINWSQLGMDAVQQ